MIIAYQSFEGQFSDNPRVLFDRLRVQQPDATHVWLAADAHRGSFPLDVATVPIYTGEGTALLEAADVLVANTHTDTDWTKRPGCVYLQTWHGTPLKRIHHDVHWAPEGRLARLDRDVARWDVLISPNAPSTPRLRAAFGFSGPVAETGYPRNDLLSSPDQVQVRRRTRSALRVPDGATAVLYTPTWRDDEVFAERPGPSTGAAALPQIVERLPAGDVLLFRCHSFDLAQHDVVRDPRVRDVSAYPDLAQLYLAADVLVTDYSSTMFDFAVTGKPLLHFVPDHERFRDEVRGFYFALEAEAPGPLLHTARELTDALAGFAFDDEGYAWRYATFRERYCGLEDGGATERVLDVLQAAVQASAGR